MSTSEKISLLIAALFGMTVSLAVSAFVPESRWTILQWLLVVPFTGSMQDLVGPTYVAFHRGLFYAITATFHALFLCVDSVPGVPSRAATQTESMAYDGTFVDR